MTDISTGVQAIADKKEEDQNRKQQQQRRRYQRQRYEEDQEEEKGKEEEEEEEEDEEEDHWKDASPLTPICSPTKIKQLKKEKATILSKNDEEIDSSNRFSSAKDKILSEEEVITPTIETMSIGMDGKEIYEIPDVITCVEQAAPKVKLKEKDSDIRRGDDITKIEKEKGREEETVGKVIVDLSDTSTLRRKKSDEEKRKCLNRYDSLDSRTQRESTETLDKSEGSSERISKKRVRSEREDEVSGVKRRSKRRETERDRRSKDGETSRRRSREERKSLKEQECIERVTQYLRKHSSLTAFNEPEPEYSYSTFDEDSSLLRSLDDERKKRMELEAAAKKEKDEKDETEEEKEVKSKDDLKDTKLVESKVYEEKKISEEGTIIESDRFREGFKRSKDNVRINDELDEIIVDPMDIRRRIESDVLVESETGSLRKRRSLKPSISDTEVAKATKRPSSLRKRKGTVSNEASKESLLEESKKEVRIRETVQEIFFEDNSDQLSTLIPEIQLVKARIITAEEVATARCFEATDLRKIQIYSPAEVVFIRQDEDTTTIDKGETSRKSSSQLQLPLLGKSVSENTLTSEDMDDNKVSERNIKPEILLDLSKVSEIVDDTIVTDKEKDNKDKKVLSRTGSEGSKRSFIGAKGKFFDECAVKVSALSLPSEPEPELTALPEDVLVIRKDDNELEGNISKDFDDKESSLEERADREEKRKQQEQQQQQQQQQQQEQKQQQQQQSKKSLTEEDVIKEKKEELGGEVVDYEKILRQQVERPLLGEDEEVLKNREEEDNLITQATVVPVVPRNFFKSVPESWKREVNEESFEDIQRNFKETQYSPREKREVETQTVQETKSTQCSPDQSLSSTAEIFETAGIHVALRFYQSPKREVQTQTQGESKSIQCSLDDLIYRELSFDPRLLVGKTLDNLVRSERIQIQESKSVQCIPEDISSEPKPKPIVDNKKEDSLFGSRKEVEVQTYQESKAVQCTDEELLPYEPDRTLDRSSNRSASLTATRNTESSASSPRKLATVVFVEGKTIMTVTQRDHDGNVAWSNHWGPERLVEIYREPKTSLGLSIVGGKVDLHNGSSSKSQNISGIFIKNVLPNSPAGRTGELKIGDRIIEVDGVDLRNSTHERAVEVIQAAGNPVCLLVQSLVHLSTENESNSQDGRSKNRLPVSGVAPGTPTASFRQKPSPISPVRSITPEVIQGGVEDSDKTPSRDFKRQSIRSTDGAGPSARRSSMKKSVRKKAPSPPSNPGILREVSEEREDHGPPVQKPPAKKYSSEESSEEEDIRELEGNVYTKGGMEISRKSAGNVKRSKAEIDADPEEEDEFGYTSMKIQKKYHNLGHKVLMVKVEKERGSLGISLAGHKDRNRMAVFICGINPNGSAHKVGGLAVGDEILEVNGMVLKGRCHLNASALIKCMAGSFFKIIVLRKTQGSDDIAVKPLVQFPPILDESEQFNAYKGVRVVPVKKGQYGLGIMIIEGKHAEVGQGIFVSDIQEGSAAEQAGLQVGDLILAVNMDCLLGSTYDEATSLLKKAEGVVKLTVCNPNQSKIGQDGKEIKPPEAEVKPVEKKEPEKPKEPEPPQDPKDCKIQVGKDTTIEFQKEKDKGIGFTITGGSDTPMSGVFILEVFPDGAAGKDGRLQAGDQILDICQESFKAIEHEKAHEAVLKVTGTIIMVVHRSDKSPEEVEVELQKKSGKGAGLCLTGFKSGKGAYVSDLLPGGSALESGKICKGDRVVAICGQDVREAPVEDIAVHIKVSNPVQLKLARYKSAKQ